MINCSFRPGGSHPENQFWQDANNILQDAALAGQDQLLELGFFYTGSKATVKE